jgi:hypothetical protein
LLEQPVEESENVRDRAAVIAQLEDKVCKLDEQLRSQTAQSAEKVRRLQEQAAHVNLALDEAKRLCESMTNSLSWRLTRPLRVLRDAVAATVKKLRRYENLPLQSRSGLPTESGSA